MPLKALEVVNFSADVLNPLGNDGLNASIKDGGKALKCIMHYLGIG